eukprot:TRINITY_DN1553_c0_g1_i1.p1 TRINITY_DN1553_c0_g1~~TRINITY_DN1553_c0_g1_i1.p1  ORF type:complete len:236 (-),score=62.92 TRINITY_DN1553_c0_g1_i1:63-770(-)
MNQKGSNYVDRKSKQHHYNHLNNSRMPLREIFPSSTSTSTSTTSSAAATTKKRKSSLISSDFTRSNKENIPVWFNNYNNQHNQYQPLVDQHHEQHQHQPNSLHNSFNQLKKSNPIFKSTLLPSTTTTSTSSSTSSTNPAKFNDLFLRSFNSQCRNDTIDSDDEINYESEISDSYYRPPLKRRPNYNKEQHHDKHTVVKASSLSIPTYMQKPTDVELDKKNPFSRILNKSKGKWRL